MGQLWQGLDGCNDAVKPVLVQHLIFDMNDDGLFGDFLCVFLNVPFRKIVRYKRFSRQSISSTQSGTLTSLL